MRKLTIERRKSLVGVSYIAPWLIGFFLLYLYPLVMSLVYTFSNLNPATGGMTWAGLENYRKLFLVDATFVRDLVTNLKVVAYDLPGTLVFSMVIALLLNQKFRGRNFFKVIFFLPIIMSSGIILQKLNEDMVSGMIMSGERSDNSAFTLSMLQARLEEMGVNEELVGMIIGTASSVFELALKSSVQILLFLAGLQAIPGSLYEAADMDGCTAWERFWKITFPMITPILIVNFVYTLTDNFIATDNPIMARIITEVQNLNFSYSAAMAWIYFLVIGAIIGVCYAIINRRVHYMEE